MKKKIVRVTFTKHTRYSGYPDEIKPGFGFYARWISHHNHEVLVQTYTNEFWRIAPYDTTYQLVSAAFCPACGGSQVAHGDDPGGGYPCPLCTSDDYNIYMQIKRKQAQRAQARKEIKRRLYAKRR